MDVIKLPGSITLTAEAYAEGDVNNLYALPIAQTLNSEMVAPGYLVAFELSPQEIEQISRTGIIYYRVLTNQFPPMNIMVDNPLKIPESGTEPLQVYIDRANPNTNKKHS